MMSKLLLVTAALALSAGAAAADPAERVDASMEDLPGWSITVSPLHLTMPVVELMAELRARGSWSAAGILGGGVVSEDGTRHAVAEVGGQVRYYMVGDFDHGLNLGGELLHIAAETEMSSVNATGTALGPFVGYKFAARFGATIDAQLGVAILAVDGDDDDDTDAAAILPLVNINAGWSF